MRIPFSLYDFLGYTVPGLVVIVILAILIEPALVIDLSNQLQNEDSGLSKFLRPTVAQGIFYVIVCYLVGFILHGCSEAFFKFAPKWKWLKKLHTDNGWFMKGVFKPEFRDSSGDFNPYSEQFVREFRNQIEDIFAIRVDKIGKDKEYTEIFDFCRSTLIKHSPTVYARAFVLLSRHESAKLMMSISFLATLGLLGRGIHLWIVSEPIKWFFPLLVGVSILLGFLFCFMYKRLLRYYRNTVIYGFYEYAVTREKSEESENNEK